MTNNIAVDLGASSYRVIISKGNELIELTRYNDHLVNIDGKLVWDITKIHNVIIDTLDETIKSGTKVHSISINSWGCDFAPIFNNYELDDAGKLITQVYASSYLNEVSSEMYDDIFEKIDESRLFTLTGINLQSFNTILRYREINAPITFIASYLNYLLTDYLEADYTIASTSQFLAREEDTYCKEILSKLHVKDINLPPLKKAGTTIKKMKLKRFKNINVIFGAGHDSAYALYQGTGQELILNIGSWIILGLNIDNVSDFKKEYSYERGLFTKYKVVKNIVGMNGFNKLLDELQIERNYEQISTELFKVEDYCKIEIDKLDIQENLLDQINKEVTPYQIIASYLNALAKYTYDQMIEFANLKPGCMEKIIVVGGGMNNKFFISRLEQILNNQYKLEFKGSEATVVGNIKFQKEILDGNSEV